MTTTDSPGDLMLDTPMPVGPSDPTPLGIAWPPPRDHAQRVAELATRLTEAEQQLRQARRLETVGRLVAGVAHDFNNLLTIIAGNAEVVRDLLPTGDPLRSAVELIVATSHTAAGVARQLLAFSKPGSGVPQLIDPVAAVRAVERTLGRFTGDRIMLEVSLPGSLPPIRVDAGQFDQVLLNLVVNARDAIGESGTVTIRAAEATVPADRPGWPADRPPGQYVALTVCDTGCGMTDEVKARAFDPFFTTKGDRGSGVGLATVRDAVRGAGGHVEVESSPGWGTSVRVFWPRALAPGVITPPPRYRPNAPAAKGETLLLVQDGNPLRDVAAVALQQAGYRVLEAADGEAGEDRARLFTGPIHLLVADVGLPKVGGVELAARVRGARPATKVLYLSGAPPPDGVDGAFLSKPYTPNELLEAVRRALDE